MFMCFFALDIRGYPWTDSKVAYLWHERRSRRVGTPSPDIGGKGTSWGPLRGPPSCHALLRLRTKKGVRPSL